MLRVNRPISYFVIVTLCSVLCTRLLLCEFSVRLPFKYLGM